MQMYHRSQSGSTVRLQMTGGGGVCVIRFRLKKKITIVGISPSMKQQGGCCLAQNAGRNIPGCHTYQVIV